MPTVGRALAAQLFDLRRLAGFGVTAATLVITGPFNTFRYPLSFRAGYWVTWLTSTWLVALTIFVVLHWLLPRWRVPGFLVSLGVLALAAPVAAGCALYVARPYFHSQVNWTSFGRETWFLLPFVAGQVLLMHLTQPRREQEAAAPPAEARPPGAEFLARLPKASGRDLMRISTAGNYIEVRTATRSHLVLLSLTRALMELEDYPGRRIHRSHWVADDAIKDQFWDGTRLFVRLTDGAVLPVSRSYRRNLLRKRPHLGATSG